MQNYVKNATGKWVPKANNTRANNAARQAFKNEQRAEEIRILKSYKKNAYGGKRTRKASRKSRKANTRRRR